MSDQNDHAAKDRPEPQTARERGQGHESRDTNRITESDLPRKVSHPEATKQSADRALESRANVNQISRDNRQNHRDAGANGETGSRSSAETAERQRVFRPSDGVGFPFNAVAPARGETDRYWQTNVSERDKKGLYSGSATMFITVGASRVGGSSYNYDLSERRGNALKSEFSEKYGVPLDSISVNFVGEGDAKLKGRPPGKDDSRDRVAIIEIIHETPTENPEKKLDFNGSVPDAVDSVFRIVAKPELDENVGEQINIFKDVLKDLAKDAIKDPETIPLLPEKGMWDVLKKEFPWMGQKWLQDRKDMPFLAQIGRHIVPGMLDALASFTGVPALDHAPGVVNNQFNRAKDDVLDRLSGLSDAERQNLATVMRSRDRSDFEKRIGEKLLATYLSHGAVHFRDRP